MHSECFSDFGYWILYERIFHPTGTGINFSFVSIFIMRMYIYYYVSNNRQQPNNKNNLNFLLRVAVTILPFFHQKIELNQYRKPIQIMCTIMNDKQQYSSSQTNFVTASNRRTIGANIRNRFNDQQNPKRRKQDYCHHYYQNTIALLSSLSSLSKWNRSIKRKRQSQKKKLFQVLLLIPLLYNYFLFCCIGISIINSSTSYLSSSDQLFLFAYAAIEEDIDKINDYSDINDDSTTQKYTANNNHIQHDDHQGNIDDIISKDDIEPEGTQSTKSQQLQEEILENTDLSSNGRKLQIQQPKLKPNKQTINEILIKAGKHGLGSGISGAIAGIIQVVSLMWIRTIISYQSRYGMTFIQSFNILVKDGGIKRLYRGISFALIQAPLSRFISTAANDSVHTLLSNISYTKHWGPERTTLIASFVAGFGRLLLMPIDTMKTVLQVDSIEGFRNLVRRVRAGRIGVLYNGSLATAASTVLSNYPWYYTYQLLSNLQIIQTIIPSLLIRNASIGLVASIVADTAVNAIRVIKTTKQSLGSSMKLSSSKSSSRTVTYMEAIRVIVSVDGYKGLFTRGLRTRIISNALQSILFTIVWRYCTDKINNGTSENTTTNTSSIHTSTNTTTY